MMTDTPTLAEGTGKLSQTFTEDERAAMKERAEELKTAAHHGSRATKIDGGSDGLAKIAEMWNDRIGSRPDRADPRHHQGYRAIPDAENLVRHARLRPGWPGRLLFLKCAEVQRPVRDARLQRQGEPRRRRLVADQRRAERSHRRRRGSYRCTHQAGRGLRKHRRRSARTSPQIT